LFAEIARWKGGGEGLHVFHDEQQELRVTFAINRALVFEHVSPLSPTLSPEYR
jgi:hypothetical protein